MRTLPVVVASTTNNSQERVLTCQQRLWAVHLAYVFFAQDVSDIAITADRRSV